MIDGLLSTIEVELDGCCISSTSFLSITLLSDDKERLKPNLSGMTKAISYTKANKPAYRQVDIPSWQIQIILALSSNGSSSTTQFLTPFLPYILTAAA